MLTYDLGVTKSSLEVVQYIYTLQVMATSHMYSFPCLQKCPKQRRGIQASLPKNAPQIGLQKLQIIDGGVLSERLRYKYSGQ